MNVLMLRPQLEVGGVAAHIGVLGRGLVREGHRVMVGTGGGPQIPALRAAGISIFELPFYPSTVSNLARSVAQLRRLVRTQRIDLLHSHHRFTTIVGRAVSWLTGVPLVATVHEFKADGRLTAACWARGPTIVPSQALKEHLVSFYGSRREAVAVIPHAIEPLPAAESRPLRVAAEARVGYIGRLAPEKGARFFVESIPLIRREFPASRFLIVGAGPEEQGLRELARRLGLADADLFLGNRGDVAELIDSFDVVVIPSLFESFSLVALEAMRAGRPVVASAVGGLPEVVRDGETGVLVPPGSPAALAGAVGSLLADAARRRELGVRAHAVFCAEYNPAAMVARTLDVYTRCVCQK
jgi:glycosyltransferase involved in cell wall biosynthesis